MLVFPIMLFLAAAQAGSTLAPQCSVVDRPVSAKVKDLPVAIQKALAEQLADPGAPFHRTDTVLPGQEGWPYMRLICGYPVAEGYVIEREQGGRGYNVGQIVFRKTPAGYEIER
jgi:hypothetical protein